MVFRPSNVIINIVPSTKNIAGHTVKFSHRIMFKATQGSTIRYGVTYFVSNLDDVGLFAHSGSFYYMTKSLDELNAELAFWRELREQRTNDEINMGNPSVGFMSSGKFVLTGRLFPV